MEKLGWLLLAIAVAFACAATVPFLRGRFARPSGWGCVVGILACPLLIPADLVVYRAVSAVVSADFAFKMIDYFRLCGPLRREVSLREYFWFLVPFPAFAIVYPDLKHRLSQPENPWPNVLRIFVGLGGIAAGFLLLRVFASVPQIRSSFALDHVAMLVAFVLTIESISRVLFGLERLAGFNTKPIIQNAFLSRTVAEFWQRYNSRVHEWFLRNIFRAGGGRRKPSRALMLVFLVSALFHELMFGIATSTFDGTQLAFFLIQAPAAMASGWFERLARRGGVAGKIVSHGFTILFLSATSVLFFRGVSRVFPFLYAAESPLR